MMKGIKSTSHSLRSDNDDETSDDDEMILQKRPTPKNPVFIDAACKFPKLTFKVK